MALLCSRWYNIMLDFKTAWCKETAHPAYQNIWSEDNPSAGQCAVTVLVVQDIYGGDIYACKVGRNSHFVNIIDDKIVDLTADQFGGTEKIRYIDGSFKLRTRESLLKNKDIKARYDLLCSRLT